MNDPELPVAVAELVEVASAVGAELRWVQAGGGNVSVKEHAADTLWVKASGCRLVDVAVDAGWVALPLAQTRRLLDEALRAMAGSHEPRAIARAAHEAICDLVEEGRPSLEAAVHAWLDERVVVHTHPWSAVVAASLGGQAVQERVPGLALIPYVSPGIELVALMKERASPSCRLTLLANHGLFATGDSAAAALAAHSEAVAAFVDLTAAPPLIVAPDAVLDVDRGQLTVDVTDLVSALGLDTDGVCQALGASLSPDFVVYCGAEAVLDREDAIEAYRKRWGVEPKLFVDDARRCWRLASSDAGRARAMTEVALGQLALVAMARASSVVLPPLTEDATRALLGWRAEAYRAQLAGGVAS